MDVKALEAADVAEAEDFGLIVGAGVAMAECPDGDRDLTCHDLGLLVTETAELGDGQGRGVTDRQDLRVGGVAHPAIGQHETAFVGDRQLHQEPVRHRGASVFPTPPTPDRASQRSAAANHATVPV
ncbi:hypothetical protein [Candidatus Mycobacterium methanotrophicum]|uniref:hypothetical protein n=1 Tax=Candidatus Mycobacterium methanotrophicum TaxID=2943498 RepID=UPI003F7CFCCB